MRRNKVIVSLFAILCFHLNTNAQNSLFDDWVEGEVYLNNGDTISGYIIYEEAQSIVQYSDKDRLRVKTYSAFVLKGFSVNFNSTQRTYTRFYWNKGYDNAQKIPDFFEVMLEGDIKVLSKDKKVTVMEDWPSTGIVGDPYSATRPPIYSERIVRNLYVQLSSGDIYGIYKPKKDLIRIFPEHKEKLKEYFRENWIYPDESQKIIDVIKMIQKM